MTAITARVNRLTRRMPENPMFPPLIVKPSAKGGRYTAISWPYQGRRFTAKQLEAWPANVVYQMPDGAGWMKTHDDQ